jgi:hypothetical protein
VPIALVLQIAQVLAAFGAAGLDAMKIYEAAKAEGRTEAKPEEIAQINAAIAKAHPAFTGTDFLAAAEPGASGWSGG